MRLSSSVTLALFAGRGVALALLAGVGDAEDVRFREDDGEQFIVVRQCSAQDGEANFGR